MIRLDQLAKRYDDGEAWAVRDIRLFVERGELVVLLGGSGCGKTTTLKMINRLIEPTEGSIEIEGKDVREGPAPALRRRIGYVFQGVGLFPHMTVGANVGVTPRLLGWPRAEIRARVDELLELVGLPPGEYRNRAPASLSGGQRQRVGVARALASRPKVMLMDEPFGALDPLTRDDMQRETLAMRDSQGLTIMLVTHDMTEALLMADRIAVMRAGRIVQCDAPAALLKAPADEYVERLVRTPMRQAEQLEALGEEHSAGEGGAP